MNPKVTAFLAVLVSAVWSASMIFDALNLNYDPPAAIHGVATLVLGAVFGERFRRDNT